MSEKKKFAVDFNYEEFGVVIVEAENKEEAKKMVHKELDDAGVDNMKFEVTGRDFNASHANEAYEGLSVGLNTE